MRRLFAVALVATPLAIGPFPALRAESSAGQATRSGALAEQANPDLQAGMAAVAAGEYAEGVASLSRVLRSLGADPSRQPELVQAYLHLGVAFAGLGQESPARSQFAQALLRQPDAKLVVKNAPELAGRLFEEARRESAPMTAAAEDRKKKASKTPLVLAGVAAVGAGVGVATASGKSPDVPPPPIGPIEPGTSFAFSSLSGNPFLSFASGEPASGSTIQVGTARPRFVYRAQGSTFAAPVGPFARLQATVELGTLDRGLCWRAESPIFALSAGQTVTLVFDAFPPAPSCAAPFTTLTVEAKLFDRDAARQLSNTIYTGGYKIVP